MNLPVKVVFKVWLFMHVAPAQWASVFDVSWCLVCCSYWVLECYSCLLVDCLTASSWEHSPFSEFCIFPDALKRLRDSGKSLHDFGKPCQWSEEQWQRIQNFVCVCVCVLPVWVNIFWHWHFEECECARLIINYMFCIYVLVLHSLSECPTLLQ